MEKWKVTPPWKEWCRGKVFPGMLKLCLCLGLCMALQVSATAGAQKVKVDLEMQNASLSKFLWTLEKQTGLVFFYNKADIASVGNIQVSYKGRELGEVLEEVLEGTGLEYVLEQNTVVIRKRAEQKKADVKIVVAGEVKDAAGDILPGVTIVLKGTKVGITSDAKGHFQMILPEIHGKIILVFSFVGMETQEVEVKSAEPLQVVMHEAVAQMEEVVITGIYTRNKESFTGSSETYKTEDLKMIGNQNILQSLKTLDPAFNIIENNQYGSDPNRLPDIEIRGKSSIVGFKEQYGQDPNQPLFILDGFETTLQTIMDLSMDRVASVTILKDAASTAIYGSKAANGVVVVETKSPTAGRLRLSYNGSYDISFADLTDYNLMDAAEKLEFEKRAGNFDTNLAVSQEQLTERYYDLLKNVKRGVNTYWMSEPLRVAFSHRHNLYLEGGDQQMRYGLGVSYTNTDGVMKNSLRDMISVNVDLIYRKEKFEFMNKLTVDYGKTENPVVSFSSYSRANPYYEKRTEGGGIEKWLEARTYENIANHSYEAFWVANPLWNDAQSSYNKGNSWGVRNSLSLQYTPVTALRFRARFGLNKDTSESEIFYSPSDTRYDKTEELKKGSYSNSRSDGWSYDGDVTVTYGQVLGGKHQINATLGATIDESNSSSKGFSGHGFPQGNFSSPGFINSYPESDAPSYRESKSRGANFYFNGGYAYDNRYLVDFNLRSDGTSVFGVNKRFSTTWAVGLAWNIHNEKFMKEHVSFINRLKIRGSVGNPGNQNFGSFTSITVYSFNNWLLNNFGTGVIVDSYGDPDLDWQRTLDKNLGVDLTMFNNRFNVTLDFYHKKTDPLMASIGLPLSVGTDSRIANVGMQVDKGINGTIRYAFVYKPQDRINYTMSVNFRCGKGYYDKIGEKLDQINRENLAKSLIRYYDGGSTSAMWSVRSAGIDPATGREVFLTKDNRYTYDYDYDDEVEVGDTRPIMEGVFGNVVYYKGFSCSVQLRYSFGADAFNYTLYNKVENITLTGLKSNQDRRALYDRWQQPGDHAKFKGISVTDSSPISSRFVMKNNFISLESIRIGYDLPQRWLQKIHVSGMNVSGYMNQICRVSSIEDERGIDYPFARSISLALSINF